MYSPCATGLAMRRVVVLRCAIFLNLTGSRDRDALALYVCSGLCADAAVFSLLGPYVAVYVLGGRGEEKKGGGKKGERR